MIDTFVDLSPLRYFMFFPMLALGPANVSIPCARFLHFCNYSNSFCWIYISLPNWSLVIYFVGRMSCKLPESTALKIIPFYHFSFNYLWQTVVILSLLQWARRPVHNQNCCGAFKGITPISLFAFIHHQILFSFFLIFYFSFSYFRQFGGSFF